jgi:Na+/H+ antiporter NhaD/arsenite permease-like protein
MSALFRRVCTTAIPLILLASPSLLLAAEAEGSTGVPNVAVWWILPFALLLGCIATMPLLNPHLWEHNYRYVSFGLAAIVAVYYLFIFPDPSAPAAWLHEMQEYISFICLLGSLFMVSGGIVIHVSRTATPITNVILLLTGAVIANVFGTTSAAMLLIRPFIRINKAHIKPYHIIFFIFIVANCGGSLTPIGDPPLFMGYLKGVPFFWVFQDCWPMWAVAVGALLITFFVIDTLDHRKTQREHVKDAGPGVEIFGFHNFVFFGVILVAVFRDSFFDALHEHHYGKLLISREVLMVAAAVASRLLTRAYIYERNNFSYGPIKEVAILFVGIFSTMVPALNYLNNNSEKMPLKTPGQFYFLSGVLSSVLDNAPTYLVFLETKQGLIQKRHAVQIGELREVLDRKRPDGVEPKPDPGTDEAVAVGYDALMKFNRKKVLASEVTDADIRIAMMVGNAPDETGKSGGLAWYIIAISIGSVFFGACTYIGNGPNFMVKSIAESAGVKCPSFFGYIVRYTLPILLPIYIAIWFIFFVLGMAMP